MNSVSNFLHRPFEYQVALRCLPELWVFFLIGTLKEHNHVLAHAQEFDFWTGSQKFKDARIDIELSQIRLHRPQSTLALP